MLNDIFYSLGRSDALDLRARANGMDGTAIIREEHKIPMWDPNRDYTDWKVGSPIKDQGQVFTLLQPHNASFYPNRPAELPALWSVRHTKDPLKAKPWFEPNGLSGAYMKDECYRKNDLIVLRCKSDNTVYDADALPSAWAVV